MSSDVEGQEDYEADFSGESSSDDRVDGGGPAEQELEREQIPGEERQPAPVLAKVAGTPPATTAESSHGKKCPCSRKFYGFANGREGIELQARPEDISEKVEESCHGQMILLER